MYLLPFKSQVRSHRQTRTIMFKKQKMNDKTNNKQTKSKKINKLRKKSIK